MSSGKRGPVGKYSVNSNDIIECDHCHLRFDAKYRVCTDCNPSGIIPTVRNDRKHTGAPKTVMLQGAKGRKQLVVVQVPTKSTAKPKPAPAKKFPTVVTTMPASASAPAPARGDPMVLNRCDFFPIPRCVRCNDENNTFETTCMCGASLRGTYFRRENFFMSDIKIRPPLCGICPNCRNNHRGNNGNPCSCGVGSLVLDEATWTDQCQLHINHLKRIINGVTAGDIKQAEDRFNLLMMCIKGAVDRTRTFTAAAADSKRRGDDTEWACPSCTFDNVLTDNKCAMCDCPQPDARRPASARSSARRPASPRPSARRPATTWDCCHCTLTNPLANNFCLACSTRKCDACG